MEPLTHFQEDILADVLRSIHLQSTLYCRAVMGAPWGFRITSREIASFHIVTGGTCWFSVDGSNKSVLLSEGDLVILPHSHAHTMTDQPGSPVTRLEHLQPTHPVGKDGVSCYGGRGAATTLVCGGLQIEGSATNPLLSILPPTIHVRGRNGQPLPWLRSIVKLVKAEASTNRLAAETIIARLSEVLFLQAVRTYLSTVSHEQTGWLAALRDPQICQALALIHHQPREPWSVSSLASSVGLSRSAFAAKFKQLTGESPMQYLTRVRLTKAAALLRTRSATLLRVAQSIGYESEVAFSKAFKRSYGVAPGTYRQAGRADGREF